MPKKQVAALSPESFNTFGDLMRYLRERAHLSQRQLSALVGYHYSYISYIEKNLRVPDDATLLGRFIPALELEAESDWVKRLLRLASGRPSIPNPPVEPAAPPVSDRKILPLPTSLTSILGRERESAELDELLNQQRH
jgi:transcriptional regulator with XRE-family HTH domain